MHEKVTIIAECCQNHNGSKETLKKMIHSAAESGAQFCKIQAIRSSELTFRQRFEEGIKDAQGNTVAIRRPYRAEKDRLSRLDLDPDTEAWFVVECLRAGIAPMITVFTRDNVEEVADMGFEAVKVASYDCASYPMLEDLKQKWSRIFVSTGATTDHEIQKAAVVLRDVNYSFLHCVTIYPTPLAELNLLRLNYLRSFTPMVGFSDHTKPAETGLKASKMAMALGATCVERHFTVLPPEETKDGPVSVNPAQLRELVEFGKLSRVERMQIVKAEIPDWENSLGQSRRDLSTEELLNRDYYRGRFASMRNGNPVYNWEDVVL